MWFPSEARLRHSRLHGRRFFSTETERRSPCSRREWLALSGVGASSDGSLCRNQDGGTPIAVAPFIASDMRLNSARDRSGRPGRGGVTPVENDILPAAPARRNWRDMAGKCQSHGPAATGVGGVVSARARNVFRTIQERSVRVGQWPACVHDRCGWGGDVRRGLRFRGGDRRVGWRVGGRRAGHR